MSGENQASIDFLNSNCEDVAPSVALNVQGLSSDHLKTLCHFFPIEFHHSAGLDFSKVQALNREFGTHQIQTVQLFAVALAIHFHFPHSKMALWHSSEIELGFPLNVSEAGQIFLEKAGFNLNVEKQNRIFSESEIKALKEQFLRFQKRQDRKGA